MDHAGLCRTTAYGLRTTEMCFEARLSPFELLCKHASCLVPRVVVVVLLHSLFISSIDLDR